MPSQFAAIEKSLISQSELPFEMRTNSSLLDTILDFHTQLTVGVGELEKTGEVDPGYAHAMDQGLFVATCGLGQIIRQSKASSPVDTTTLEARLDAGCDILRIIARCPVDWAASVEERYRFIRWGFDNPRENLLLDGPTVRLAPLLWARTVQSAADNSKGCPFQKAMEKLYPSLIRTMLPFYSLQT